MWKSSLLEKGTVHLWHDIFSNNNAKILGFVGCRVTSKILGIGNAERAWGAVKQLKSGRRGHLSGSNTKKQATIFAKACIDDAKLRRENAIKNDDSTYTCWTDDDDLFLMKVGIHEQEKTEQRSNMPPFKC